MFFDDSNSFLDDLNTNLVTDEWCMSNFADQHIKTLESHEAFDILKQFVVYMIENYDEKSEYEIVETLRYLKYQASTNESFCSNEQKDKILDKCISDFYYSFQIRHAISEEVKN
ncbi:hypothetical protein M2R47_08600 [Moraxella sp. Tifton1]|uniref:hypothetical protein n=1 Tax=Moraxella oculi TaxID=2940516 RepID=UPI002012AA4D|nr:hypothetical protein [Moraxella sp. Tifton1]MCL1624292.1 hypothetical protein [Moraxella sp. Tifton1]